MRTTPEGLIPIIGTVMIVAGVGSVTAAIAGWTRALLWLTVIQAPFALYIGMTSFPYNLIGLASLLQFIAVILISESKRKAG